MICHAWTVLCRGTSVDRTSNNVTLFDVIEQLAVPTRQPAQNVIQFGLSPAFFSLVTLWSRQDLDRPCRGRAKTEFVLPSGESREFGEYDVDLTEHPRLRMIARLFGFPARDAGLHWIQVSLRQADDDPWRVVGRTPVQVDLPDPEIQAAAEGAQAAIQELEE